MWMQAWRKRRKRRKRMLMMERLTRLEKAWSTWVEQMHSQKHEQETKTKMRVNWDPSSRSLSRYSLCSFHLSRPLDCCFGFVHQLSLARVLVLMGGFDFPPLRHRPPHPCPAQYHTLYLHHLVFSRSALHAGHSMKQCWAPTMMKT
jgi:hypothetical protein